MHLINPELRDAVLTAASNAFMRCRFEALAWQLVEQAIPDPTRPKPQYVSFLNHRPIVSNPAPRFNRADAVATLERTRQLAADTPTADLAALALELAGILELTIPEGKRPEPVTAKSQQVMAPLTEKQIEAIVLSIPPEDAFQAGLPA